CGQRLTPRPRRDLLRRLALDADRLVFLMPLGGGQWVPVSVPESAFAPLEDCVDHVAQPRLAAFAASSPRHRLEWESFEELDTSVRAKAEVRPPPAAAKATPGPRPRAAEPGWLERLQGKLFASKKPLPLVKVKVGDAVQRALPEDAAPPPPDATGRRPDLHERRSELEAKFVQTLDGRAADAGLLPELAGLHAQLGYAGDAAICWLNAIWDADEPPDFWIWGWLQSEKKLSRVLFGENELPRLVAATPSPSSVRLLAAAVTWHAKKSPGVLADQLGEFRLLLECHEDWLPVRSAWLAHAALATVADGDVLALARTRDRLAARLIQNGLSLELDVPSFVRFSGRDAGDRFQLVRDWLVKSRDLMHRWADQLTRNRPANYCRALPEEFPDRDGHCTKALVDLMLSWGLARLGERNTARQLTADARAQLAHAGDPVLNFLGEAFQFRINRALENAPSAGPLPPGLLAELDRLRQEPGGERQVLAPYRIDALRHLSRILEPTQHINPYRPPMVAGDAPKVDSAVAVAAAEAALARVPVNLGDARRYLEAALESAGDALHDRLDDVVRLAERFPDPLPSVLLLAKAFELAAARGDVTAAELLLPRLVRLFRGDGPRFGDLASRLQQPAPPDDPRGADAQRRLEALPGYCLRDLRRLGLTAEADSMLLPAVEWVLHRKPLEILRVTQPDTWPSALRAVLRLAGNWFADHDEDRAVTVLDSARKNLLYAPDLSPKERSALARSYAAALAHAPPRMALGRFEEMFRDLGGLYEERQTNSHYALQPLALVDAVVRAALSDHFTLGSAVRRWLDADEFRVRQRLQRDLNSALELGALRTRMSEL
ncbi:MAG: hypothetical protein ACJ8F7_08455, partial [Gemmataceae bacterium]